MIKENICIICGCYQDERQLDNDYLLDVCKQCISAKDVMTFTEFQLSRQKKPRSFMVENYDKSFIDESMYSDFHLVYFNQYTDIIGYIEIEHEKKGIYFCNISNWDDVSDDLEYLEKKLYSDHYLTNI